MIFIIKRNVMIVTKKDIMETMETMEGTNGVDDTSGSSSSKGLIKRGFDWLNSKIKKVGDAIASRNENLTIEVIDELFSIHEECENPSFFISKDIKNFGEPMMEKSGDCYQVAVNPKYKDLSFVFETIKEMYDNNEFSGMLSESEVVCEECLEINVEKKLLENMDVWMSKYQISEDVMYHLNNSVPLLENIYRPGSPKHAMVIKETRELWESGAIKLSELSVKLFESTDLGKFDLYEGVMVPLDLPFTVDMTEEEILAEAKYQGKDVEIGKPKRGGSKKFYVYVRKPGGGIKKVSFGDTTGLSVKLNNPEARKAFAARHDCANKKDRTKASYWSCRLPRYASLLGLKSKFGGYW
jgi:hypothetical protein